MNSARTVKVRAFLQNPHREARFRQDNALLKYCGGVVSRKILVKMQICERINFRKWSLAVFFVYSGSIFESTV